MEIRRMHLLKGAEEASGIAVIIDVFRAFSDEVCMFERGAEHVYCVKEVQDAFAMKERFPEALLAGERNGIKVEGFDFGNSPAEIMKQDLTGKTVIHTTSAGVQGLMAAVHADEIITGSLRNAKAIASYIKRKNPDVVSLCAMGWNGTRETEEDELCAEYIESLLNDNEMENIKERALYLKEQEGKKFFDPAQKDVFPEGDFWLCIETDVSDFVLKAVKHEGCFEMIRVQ